MRQFRRDCGYDYLRSTARRLAGNWCDTCRYNLFECPVQPRKSVKKNAHYCLHFLSRVGELRRRLRISEASQPANGKLRFGCSFAGCGKDNCTRMLEDESTPKRRVRLRVRGATESRRMWQRREVRHKFGIKTLAELQHMKIKRVLKLARGNVGACGTIARHWESDHLPQNQTKAAKRETESNGAMDKTQADHTNVKAQTRAQEAARDAA